MSDDLVERVARHAFITLQTDRDVANKWENADAETHRTWCIIARAAIAIALEEAARVAEIYEYDELEDDGGATIKPSAAIRAMIKGNDVQQA